MEQTWKRYIIPGGLAGFIATVTMSIVLVLAKAAGLLKTPPPKQVTENAARKAGGTPEVVPEGVRKVLWMAAHLGYGTVTGVGYAAGRRFLPAQPAVAGFLFGESFWALNYLGALPLMGIYPTPDDDRTSRTLVMILAHAVYGVALAEAESRVPRIPVLRRLGDR